MNEYQLDADGHRSSDHPAEPRSLEEAEAYLREAVDVGCTDSTHDHIKDYRNAMIRWSAEHVESIAQIMRECTGEYPEEWSSRDVRDAVESAAASLRCTQDKA